MFVFVSGFGVYKGLNIRRLSDWIFSLSALLTGLLLGYLRNDIISGCKVGVLIAVIVMIAGIVVREQRRLWSGGGDG